MGWRQLGDVGRRVDKESLGETVGLQWLLYYLHGARQTNQTGQTRSGQVSVKGERRYQGPQWGWMGRKVQRYISIRVHDLTCTESGGPGVAGDGTRRVQMASKAFGYRLHALAGGREHLNCDQH